MKRFIAPILVLCLIFSCIGVLGCSGNSDSTAPQSTSSGSNSTSSAAQTTAASSGGALWSDMPVYSGASQVQKGSWSLPPTEGDYAQMEWRYYETNDALAKVSAFYKSEMPAKGWTQQGWMEAGDMNWGMFNKNDENDAAMVSLSSQDGKTVIALWRASK